MCISKAIQRTYGFRLAFRKILKIYSLPNIERYIQLWLKEVENSHLPEFSNLEVSFISWFPQVINAFVLPYSNGFIEGCNNNIKVLKRISYELCHFKCFRVHILLLSKKNRGKLILLEQLSSISFGTILLQPTRNRQILTFGELRCFTSFFKAVFFTFFHTWVTSQEACFFKRLTKFAIYF